jgi:hypothetical protein
LSDVPDAAVSIYYSTVIEKKIILFHIPELKIGGLKLLESANQAIFGSSAGIPALKQ